MSYFNNRTASVLMLNASMQILVSTILGFVMLVPMQPWGKDIKPFLPTMHAMLAVHIDWYMLAFMEFACALIFITHPSITSWGIARLLMFGGWVNVIPYVLRDMGVNAFVFGGSPVQIISASIAGISSLSICIGWVLIVLRFYRLLNRVEDPSKEKHC